LLRIEDHATMVRRCVPNADPRYVTVPILRVSPARRVPTLKPRHTRKWNPPPAGWRLGRGVADREGVAPGYHPLRRRPTTRPRYGAPTHRTRAPQGPS